VETKGDGRGVPVVAPYWWTKAQASQYLWTAPRISVSVFPLLGTAPILGRAFTEEEDLPGPPAAVALVSEKRWRERSVPNDNWVGVAGDFDIGRDMVDSNVPDVQPW
jgi:hypothetical protein